MNLHNWMYNHALKKTFFILMIISTSIIHTNIVFAAKSRQTPLRSFGDYTQIINPLIAGSIASQEKGLGHFAIIYGQSCIATHSIKYLSYQGKWKMSKRPFIADKKERYDGMPSGHTNSAWIAASYIRTFSKENQYLSIPLYIAAAITGYSRVRAKEHTTTQVLVGMALAEIITYINSKLNWSNAYRSSNIYIAGDEVSASLKLNL